MKDSAKKLRDYLQKEYINNPSMGSLDMYAAMRDLITDICHISKSMSYCPHYLMENAEEVFNEEIELEKTA